MSGRQVKTPRRNAPQSEEHPPKPAVDDGLITPRSTGTVSPEMNAWYSTLSLRLERMCISDFRKLAVTRELPGTPWPDVCVAAQQLSIPDQLTWPELQLLVLEWHSAGPINFVMLEEECFARDRAYIHSRVMSLEEKYGTKRGFLKCSEVCALELAIETQMFTFRELAPYLPGFTAERLKGLVSAHYPYKLRWTLAEIEYIEEGVKQGLTAEVLALNLPFRKLGIVRQKALVLRKKMFVQPVIIRDVEYDERIDALIRTDLTGTGIKEAALNESLSKLIKDIQTVIEDRDGSENIPFTKPENEILRLSLKKEISDKECQAELLFRSWREIEQRRRNLECVHSRQSKFSNRLERLVYEAQWYSSMPEESASGGRRRRAKSEVEFSDLREEALKVRKPKKPKIDVALDAEAQARARAKDLSKQKRKETLRRKHEQKEMRKNARKAAPPRTRLRANRIKTGERCKIHQLIQEAEWFQSISGDGSAVKTGTKRKRTPALHLVPEFKDRQKLKTAQKQLMEQKRVERERQKQQKEQKEQEPLKEQEIEKVRVMSETPMTEDSDAEKELMEKFQKVLDEENPSDLEEISPFDPTDINHDTTVAFEGRFLFNENISSRILFPSKVDFNSDVLVLLQPGLELPVNNTLAASVIREHDRGYRLLPNTFPPFLVETAAGKLELNARNILHIRYLLYPQHTEQYILAEPKSNQLDPVREILKVFQIHYGLFFSYLTKIKNIVLDDFCETLVQAVEENDFLKFMFVVDKWNALMLELCPYPIEIDPKIDINESLRVYLPKGYSFFHDIKDSKLQTFYMEVLTAGELARKNATLAPTPGKMATRKMSLTLKSPVISLGTGAKGGAFHSQLPEVFVSRYRHLRPMAYAVAFIDLLAYKTTISRYCSHQLLMRAYTRIVSPQSKKLRSYKAFSAEVYGELLPSFVSEVLTKIDFQPYKKFYDLGCGVGNTTLQVALEFGAEKSGGCEIMDHASRLALLQEIFMQKQICLFGLKPMQLSFALDQSFVQNEAVRKECIKSDVVLVNNYLFEFPLNVEVGKLLYGMKPGSKIISLKNFIPPRYKSSGEQTVFDFLRVERFEMSDYCSVSWTANKVPYYISTVEREILKEYQT